MGLPREIGMEVEILGALEDFLSMSPSVILFFVKPGSRMFW